MTTSDGPEDLLEMSLQFVRVGGADRDHTMCSKKQMVKDKLERNRGPTQDGSMETSDMESSFMYDIHQPWM